MIEVTVSGGMWVVVELVSYTFRYFRKISHTGETKRQADLQEKVFCTKHSSLTLIWNSILVCLERRLE